MSKSWLEIVLPAGLAVVALAIMAVLFSAGNLLLQPPRAAPEVVAAVPDSVVITEFGVMRVTESGMERLPDSVAARYLPAPDSALLNLNPADVAAGAALFKSNCAQCHAMQDVVVGPALAGLHKRRSDSWLLPWIRNSSKVVASGDEYAVKIFNQYGKQQMPSFQITDKEIQQILVYIKSEHNYASAVARAN
ncbi:c-type cytochrome [Hymenobacter tenuis]